MQSVVALLDEIKLNQNDRPEALTSPYSPVAGFEITEIGPKKYGRRKPLEQWLSEHQSTFSRNINRALVRGTAQDVWKILVRDQASTRNSIGSDFRYPCLRQPSFIEAYWIIENYPLLILEVLTQQRVTDMKSNTRGSLASAESLHVIFHHLIARKY